jgi:hypothetical protein
VLHEHRALILLSADSPTSCVSEVLQAMKGNKTPAMGNKFAQECMDKNWDIEQVMEVVICR